MSRVVLVSLTACLLLLSRAAAAQASHPHFMQVAFGPALRTAGPVSAAGSQGISVVARGGLHLLPHLGLVTEVSVARFTAPPLTLALLCPLGVMCRRQIQPPGLGLLGVTAGLQPHVQAGPVALRLTASVGGYWLYDRASSFAALTPGAQATVGLGLPIGGRLQVLVEGGAAQLWRAGLHEANTRHIHIGVALN